jgi:CCR4-NOT transcription complex subunit 1
LIECILVFLKNNLIPGYITPPVIQAFYHATLRVINVIKQDFPDFLSDFHFSFVNTLPEHSIQLKNLILSATPSNI